MRPDPKPRAQPSTLAQRFTAFIRERDFPCVGAKSALAHNTLRIVEARDLNSAWDDLRIYAALLDFAAAYRAAPGPFQSLAVIFRKAGDMDEAAFEQAMWARIQSLSDKDGWLGQAWDPRVSADVADPHFSLSFGGEAFFVVGLHPKASRPARRFEAPVMVFNPHDQFERLRAEGRYEGLRESIIARDVALAGSPNPMITRFGEASEARQYSGRAVGPEWACPFHAKPRVCTDEPD
jgi:FPC/CPF motif-containing protein YcgG